MTNLPFFLARWVPALAVCIIAADLVLLPAVGGPHAGPPPYTRCARLVKSDPAQALAFAQRWRASHPGSVLAKHCEGVASFAMKDYPHAAELFMSLAKMIAATDPLLAGRVFLQAEDAYRAAGRTGEAKQAGAAALLLNPGPKAEKSLPTEIKAKTPSFIGPPPPPTLLK